jgi:hypothetical protein
MATSPSTVISMRLPAASTVRLKRMASRHGWTPSDTSARLVEEGLRRSEFAFIDFRDSIVGRQAYLQGSGLAVWEVAMLLRDYNGNVAAVAAHLQWPSAKVHAARLYAEAFPDEVNSALAENDAMDFTSLQRLFPDAIEYVVPTKKTASRGRRNAKTASR